MLAWFPLSPLRACAISPRLICWSFVVMAISFPFACRTHFHLRRHQLLRHERRPVSKNRPHRGATARITRYTRRPARDQRSKFLGESLDRLAALVSNGNTQHDLAHVGR